MLVQLTVDVGMSPQEYGEGFREVVWPVLEECPSCYARARLHGHGWYARNGLPSWECTLRLMIRRLLCPVCEQTVSLLPSFLLPRFQYTVEFIVKALLGMVKSYRELFRFYWRRWLGNANRVLAALRDLGIQESLPSDVKARAMKLLESIESFGVERFSLLFQRRFCRGFMAV